MIATWRGQTVRYFAADIKYHKMSRDVTKRHNFCASSIVIKSANLSLQMAPYSTNMMMR